MNEILKETRWQRSPNHYNDGCVDYRVIQGNSKRRFFFGGIGVFVSESGFSKAISLEDNFFAPIELVKAYRLAISTAIEESPIEDYVAAFKAYLIRTGCDPEDLIEEEEA